MACASDEVAPVCGNSDERSDEKSDDADTPTGDENSRTDMNEGTTPTTHTGSAGRWAAHKFLTAPVCNSQHLGGRWNKWVLAVHSSPWPMQTIAQQSPCPARITVCTRLTFRHLAVVFKKSSSKRRERLRAGQRHAIRLRPRITNPKPRRQKAHEHGNEDQWQDAHRQGRCGHPRCGG